METCFYSELTPTSLLENFLYGFVVPILPYMIEKRLNLDPAYTQRFTTELLFILGLVSVPAAPVIGHFADKTTSRKIPLLISLVGCTIGTLLVASTPSSDLTTSVMVLCADSLQYGPFTWGASSKASPAWEPGSWGSPC